MRLRRASMTARRVFATFVALCIPSVFSNCYNFCSGHGECNSDSQCECDDGWGYAADCSLMDCPTAPAWADKASAGNEAHSEMECANVGTCDRTTGSCLCPAGFTGRACQRLACPAGCSGNGVCTTLAQAAEFYGYTASGLGNYSYTNWDANIITMCVCDWGFTGASCALRLCPKGDDPLTVDQSYRAVNLTTYAGTGVLAGEFLISFQGESVSVSADASDLSAADLEELLESMPNVGDVDVTRWDDDSDLTNGATYTITFVEWPTFPHQNNLFSHDGDPPVGDFSCDKSGVTGTNTGVTCVFADYVDTDLCAEYTACSGRGLCDMSVGRCACYDGYGEANCDTADDVVVASEDVDVLLLEAQDDDFTGNMLHIKTTAVADDVYNILQIDSDSDDTLVMTGLGDIRMYKGGLTIDVGGQTITAGGLTITGGGLTVTDGGVVITDDGLLVSAGDVTLMAGDLIVSAGSITAASGKLTVAGVLSSAAVTVNADIVSTGSITAASGKLTIKGIVSSDVVTATSGGVTVVSGGIWVKAGGAEIDSGGLLVAGGAVTITSTAGLFVTNDIEISMGSVTATTGALILDTGSVTVTSGELYVGGGVTSAAAVTLSGGDLVLAVGSITATKGALVLDTGSVTVSS
ncbi:unnamed protein product, partial [Phaeothamnion confervicola]